MKGSSKKRNKKSQLRINGRTFSYPNDPNDFEGEIKEEAKKLLPLCVEYMIQTAIYKQQLVTKRLSPDKNKWWMNVTCTSIKCTSKIDVIKELMKINKDYVELAKVNAKSVFVNMKTKRKREQRILNEVIRPGDDPTLINFWLTHLDEMDPSNDVLHEAYSNDELEELGFLKDFSPITHGGGGEGGGGEGGGGGGKGGGGGEEGGGGGGGGGGRRGGGGGGGSTGLLFASIFIVTAILGCSQTATLQHYLGYHVPAKITPGKHFHLINQSNDKKY